MVQPIEMFQSGILTFACSCILTWFFDTLRLLINRIKNKRKTILLSLIDCISVISYSLLMILTLFYTNKGIFRGVYAASIILGIYIYLAIISKILRKLTIMILIPPITAIRFVWNILTKILVFLFLTIEKIHIKLYNNNVKNTIL